VTTSSLSAANVTYAEIETLTGDRMDHMRCLADESQPLRAMQRSASIQPADTSSVARQLDPTKKVAESAP
jgi:hypothetical protein